MVLTEQTIRHDLANTHSELKIKHELLLGEYKNLQKENEDLKIRLATTTCTLVECPSKKINQ
jgi:regulator of replication initiation timing